MPTLPKLSKRLIRNLLLLLTAALATAGALFLIWQAHPELEYWMQLALDGRAFLEAHPLALIAALAILPGLGFPLSPMLILFAVVMGPRFGIPTTCAIAIAATSFCSIWSYALASGPLRNILKKYVLKDRALPELSDRSALRVGLIIRITPGIPYPLQNVVLGVMGMRFKTYLLASLPVQALYTIGFIVTGGAIFEGHTGLAITGALLLVAVILITRMLHNRSQRNAQ